MKTILLPTDFSGPARHAIDYAVHLYGLDVQYILLHAYHTPEAGATLLYSINPILEEEARKSLEALTADLTAKYGTGLKLRKKTLVGGVAESCRQMLKQHSIDLIVMGTKGASGLREVLIGSNTASTIASVDCPVLAVPENAELSMPKRVTFATDYGEIGNEQVLEPLLDLLKRGGAELSIVHVQPVETTGFEEDAFTDTAWPSALLAVPHSHSEIKGDNVIRGLEQHVEEVKPDLLAMLEHRYGLLEALFHRSVTKRMAMHSTVPLLALQDVKR